uniref:Retrotransposon Copia-like N-terminal domain-containing protein n=1 Tax=Cannabis sativa TaxID=3483 RepID=A0A803PAL4_CANSA
MEIPCTSNGGARLNNAQTENNHQTLLPKSYTVSFTHSLPIKLDEHNYLPWRHQVLASIKGSRLLNYLDPDRAPPKFLSTTDERSHTVNPEFEDWEQQDNLLVSWLLSSMSEKTTHWIVDLLTTIGHKKTPQDHIESIFNGLLIEYDVFVTTITTRKHVYTVAEIEALLMAQSARIDKHTKNLDILKAKANLSHSRFNGFNPYNRSPYSAPAIPPGFSRGGPNRFDGFTGASIDSFTGPESFANFPATAHVAKLPAMHAKPEIILEDNWYPDSGATHHLTPDATNLGSSTLYRSVSNFSLDVLCDADWASDLDDRCSTLGHCIYLGGNLVAWKSQKQDTISRKALPNLPHSDDYSSWSLIRFHEALRPN